ncbi:DUF3303 domain-containing protein [Microvirga sp. 2MCAF35]|uniref:DUF3303 domain-containing protein n=1 Tax=Microvirga sp. 2MCAF35 TaxID=3232987 RepID=UPI003F995CF6
MLFVVIGKPKAASRGKERITRRMSWGYPMAMRMIAEYWPMPTEIAVFAIEEFDNVASLMAAIVDWDDVVDLTVMPAMTAKQGLELARQMPASSSI